MLDIERCRREIAAIEALICAGRARAVPGVVGLVRRIAAHRAGDDFASENARRGRSRAGRKAGRGCYFFIE